MGKEIERKFLVKNDSWRSLLTYIFPMESGTLYRQGFLNSLEMENQMLSKKNEKIKYRKCSECKGRGYEYVEKTLVCVGCVNLYSPDEGLVDCIKCNSNGYILIDNILFRCPKCDGRGEVDWVEQVISSSKRMYPRPDLSFLIKRYKEDNNIIYPKTVVNQGIKVKEGGGDNEWVLHVLYDSPWIRHQP